MVNRTEPMLVLTGVSKAYPGERTVQVLDQASLTVCRGESVADRKSTRLNSSH